MAFADDALAEMKARYWEVTAAVTALLSDGVQRYELDTGQTTQEVTLLDLSTLQAELPGLLNQITVLENRTTGAGVSHGRPAW